MAGSSKALRIVVIGGGSNAWTPNLVKDMLLTEGLENSTFVLYDINLKVAQFVAQACQAIAKGLGKPLDVVPTDDRKLAFQGADYFLVTISTGGLDAMAHDLKIPEKFGIYHTVGDTSGPGGWARLIRNFDVFVDLAHAFNKYAPHAPVLNYTNPMTTLTTVLSRICKAPVVGLCHGLFESLWFLKKFYGVDEDQITTRYAGLNHFFWITEARAKGIDLLADLRKQLKNKSITDLRRAIDPDSFGFHSYRELATELFHATGALPYLGDRHTCEFVPWGITDVKRMAKYKLHRTTIKERRDGFNKRNVRLKNIIKTGDLSGGYNQRSRETAADIIAAHSQGKVFIDVGNTANIGQVENLPRGTVVETPVRIDPLGFSPIAYGKLPPQILGLVEPYAHVFNTVVDACFEKNKTKALQALRIDPVCSHLTTAQVNDLGERLLKAHDKFITAF